MKFSVTLTLVGLLGFAASWIWLAVDALDPSGGVPIGIGMLCMLTAFLTVAGLLCILATWLSRFIVGREDAPRE
ncbi:hypothetical protein [Kocuria rhizophila]|uniref:hypothetical protein n=1 Tax=Kocuria rhizophila TaxID=72000 RepID=UPI001E43DBEE|nr:hypothetical protein [Kocuria rhizophila]